jgi:integrase
MMRVDLFSPATALDRKDALDRVFEGWVAHRAVSNSHSKGTRPLRVDSIEVYRDMWQVFVAWSVNRGLALETLDKGLLIEFLDSLGGPRDATLRYAKRMLGLIERVAAHAASQQDQPVNPAIAAVAALPRFRFGDAAVDEPLPEFLAAGQARRLIAFVTERREINGAQVTWQEVRNRTSIAVQLGAGLTPGEARSLELDALVIEGRSKQGEPWAIAVPANGNYAARQTPVARWAGRQLRYWLDVRANQSIPGTALFPSVRSGKPWSKPGAAAAFQSVLEAAGIAGAGGSFKLRHTFALRQLTRHSEETVAGWLGVQDPAIMARYRRVLYQPVDIV